MHPSFLGDDGGASRSAVWAPDVREIKSGHYVMYCKPRCYPTKLYCPLTDLLRAYTHRHCTP